MRMSDIVSQRILELLTESDGIAEICRNELADDIGCVPSQINYVLTSRFTPEHGYVIESRRGGGGYIRITRVKLGANNAKMHLINSIRENIDANSAQAIIENILDQDLISVQQAEIMSAAVSENPYRFLQVEERDKFRAILLKNMLMRAMK